MTAFYEYYEVFAYTDIRFVNYLYLCYYIIISSLFLIVFKMLSIFFYNKYLYYTKYYNKRVIVY